MRKILTTTIVVVELVAVSAGAAMAASAPLPATSQHGIIADNAAAAVQIQENYELQSENTGH
jgi:hypothetical protein